jgi:hypothetical protein
MIQYQSKYNPLSAILEALPSRIPFRISIDTYRLIYLELIKGGWECESPADMHACFKTLEELNIIEFPKEGDFLLIGNKYNGI